jgi:hypothetical protein
VAYKGCRVEVAGFRSNTAPKLIDVADYFIDLGEIADKVRKEANHSARYYENQHHAPYANHEPHRNTHDIEPHRAPEPLPESEGNGAHRPAVDAPREAPTAPFAPAVAHVMADVDLERGDAEQFTDPSGFVRVTDDQ